MLFPPDFNLSINVSYKRLEIMLFRYCLNVILDVILEKHFWNSFRKKLNVDVFQFYFRCHPKDECLFLICFFYTFSFQDWNNTSCFFLKTSSNQNNYIHSYLLYLYDYFIFCCQYEQCCKNVTYQASTIVISWTKINWQWIKTLNVVKVTMPVIINFPLCILFEPCCALCETINKLLELCRF